MYGHLDITILDLQQKIYYTKYEEVKWANDLAWRTEMQKQYIKAGLQDGTAIQAPHSAALLIAKMYTPKSKYFLGATTEATQAWFREHHNIEVDDYEMREEDDDKEMTHYFRVKKAVLKD